MSDIKLPQIEVNIDKNYDLPTPENQWKQVNPSCLLSYLGIKGYGINAIPTANDVTIRKMAIPLLGYYDIFKNFYANTQEENFYTIGATDAINKIIVTQKTGSKIELSTPDKINTGIANGDAVLIFPINTYEADELTVTWFDAASQTSKVEKPIDFGTWNKTTGQWVVKMPETTAGVLMSITPITRVKLQKYPLEDIDLMRDLIYGEKGNTTTIITEGYPGYDLPLYQSFVKTYS